MIKVRRPARTMLQLLNAREKVFRPQGIFLSGKDPVASLSLSRGRKGDGILFFGYKSISRCNLCGPPCLCGKRSQTKFHHRDTEVHRGFTERVASAASPAGKL